MPSASTTAKLEKQASSEASDPIRQGIVFVEHKIRNLLKKKARLDTYKEIQKSGKELDTDQKQALLKYDELNQNITFAQDLSKQLNNIAVDNVKQQKKKEKKEAYEREQQEAAKVKEILIIQDVLASMGNETVREDFLAGKNKAAKLTETELQFLDELFVEVSPKREPEEGQPPFLDQALNAAKHLLSIVEGKEKEIVGTKYSTLKEIIGKVNNSGYFDHAVAEPVAQEPVAEVAVPEPEPEPEVQAVEQPPPPPVPVPVPIQPILQQFETNEVVAVAPVMETAGLYISQRPMADVLTNVMGPGPTAFSFIQESQLESPDVVVPAPLPIPTQTFTNASFVAAAPVPVYEVPVQSNALPTSTPQAGGDGDWNEAPEQSNDWSMQAEQGSWSETTNSNNQQDAANDWANDTNANDGFQTAGRGGGRGRGRGGRGGPRGERGGRGTGGYQNGRGGGGYGSYNGGGRGGYNRNGEGGGGGGGYYQNGYQSRGDGERGQRRGGPRGGGGSDRGAPRQDRGGPRGAGGRGGPRGGGYRGGNRGGQ